MNNVLLICREEWRFWLRSRLASSALLLMALVLVGATLNTTVHSAAETTRRESLQQLAEATFINQPARHPHRMVHYGHYAFRAPVPLAALDPGIDPYAGMVMFLEGHRQNSATFAEATELASLSRFGSLSPAFVLQVLAPLLLVIMGYASISRERERRTLLLLQTNGVANAALLGGKALALMSVAGLMLLPLLLAGILLASTANADVTGVLALVAVYGIYLAAWVAATIASSALLRSTAASLAVLLLAWVCGVVVLPKLAGDTARALDPVPGKIATDLTLLTDVTLADGHNTADPGFAALTAQLLDTYGVDDVAALPINIRGIVSAEGEAAGTATLNQYADERMAAELRQATLVDRLSFLSPVLAVRRASMALAGTDLLHYHRFLREAEAVRFDFVQGLNKLHAEELEYAEDIKRSVDAAAEQSTRVAASNWQLLPEYHFNVAPVAERVAAALPMTAVLLAWLLALVALCGLAGRKVQA